MLPIARAGTDPAHPPAGDGQPHPPAGDDPAHLPAGDSQPVPRRLRRDAEANRRHVLEAAGRLMAERGLGTPLEDIAAAAGVGIGTLYRRFPTRNALIEALFEDRVGAYLTDLQAAVAMPDGWHALVWFLRRSAARQIADRALSELLEHDPGPGAIRQLRERVVPLVDELVVHAKATGRLRPDFAPCDLLFVQQMLATVGTATAAIDDSAWLRYLTIMVDGLVVARSRPTPPEEPAFTVDQLRALRDAQPAGCRSARSYPAVAPSSGARSS